MPHKRRSVTKSNKGRATARRKSVTGVARSAKGRAIAKKSKARRKTR